MRGDAHSNAGGAGEGGAQHLQQQDSSSGSSSPNSNTSNDEDILEVSAPPSGFAARVHNIYNFSIPDVIKHEPRVQVARVNTNEQRSDCMQMRNPGVRKRTCAARNVNSNNINNNNNNNNNNSNSNNIIDSEQINNDENDVPVPLTHKKKRRRITAADNLMVEEDDDADCHHHRPPVIDLTNIDSHDDFSNALSDSEVHDSSHIETRPLHHTPRPPSFNEVLTNLQRFRQQLDSQERAHFLRSQYTSRMHRLRRRRNSRAIVTDGPLVTDDMLVQSAEANLNTPEMTSADDSVMVINEVRGDGSLYIDDHDIALRMASDPTYSPPYASLPNTDHYRSHYRHSRTDESFHQFQERIRCIRQRSRDRLEQVRRISQQAQERLARLHESITSLRPARRLAEGDGECPGENGGGGGESGDGGEGNSDAENIEVYDANDVDDDDENNDVEIIRESLPPPEPFLEPFDIGALGPLPMAVRTPLGGREVTNQLPVGTLPDFLRNSLMSTLNPPRLSHHLHDIPGYEDLWNLAERLGPAKPRGLNKPEIEQIPSFRFSATTAKETNRKCVVCMGEYINREKLRRLPCSHDFHSKCIDKWLKSNKTCPVCRDEVKVEPNKPYTP